MRASQPRGATWGGIPTQGKSPRLQTRCSEEDWLKMSSGGAPFIPLLNLTCGHFNPCRAKGHFSAPGISRPASSIFKLRPLGFGVLFSSPPCPEKFRLLSGAGGCTCHMGTWRWAGTWKWPGDVEMDRGTEMGWGRGDGLGHGDGGQTQHRSRQAGALSRSNIGEGS